MMFTLEGGRKYCRSVTSHVEGIRKTWIMKGGGILMKSVNVIYECLLEVKLDVRKVINYTR